MGSTNNSNRYMNGMVGEVKIYNTALSAEDFAAEQQALIRKWLVSELYPPTPNPATFSIAPVAVSGTVISMMATTGSDVSGPVEYLFTEVSGNPGGTSSGWQTSPMYRDGDLEPLMQYTYIVTMRDRSGSTGTASSGANATTLEPQPLQPLQDDLDYGAYYGYQGWHFCTGDGRVESDNWVHWFEGGIPDADHIHGDMWPDMQEYDPNNVYETHMQYADGETAKLYSAFDYSTIDLHVKWMKEYGIKGCVVQRFTSLIDTAAKLEQGDNKILAVMTACEKYGVKFWIMHDSGKGDLNEVNRITNDWKHLVDDLDILQSPSYAFQNGLPAYGLWGVGIDTRAWAPDTEHEILDFYQNGLAQYQAYVVGGVPINWRSNPPAGWSPVFDRLDMISSWRTIFYNTESLDKMYADFEYCSTNGIDYNPVISPGASTMHMRDNPAMRNWKPRNGGKYFWKQVYEVCRMGSKFMYVAMFDEVDEGTAMYKLAETSADLPVDANQVALDEDGYDLPSDWYLQLGREAQKMLDGTIELIDSIPITPQLLGKVTLTSNETRSYNEK